MKRSMQVAAGYLICFGAWAEEQPAQVGRNVTANMDVVSMILSLLLVLALIFISALVLKKFNLGQQVSGGIKVVASQTIGAKEKLVVVEIADQQLLLGVTPNQINLLKTFDEPVIESTEKSGDFGMSIQHLMKKKS